MDVLSRMGHSLEGNINIGKVRFLRFKSPVEGDSLVRDQEEQQYSVHAARHLVIPTVDTLLLPHFSNYAGLTISYVPVRQRVKPELVWKLL